MVLCGGLQFRELSCSTILQLDEDVVFLQDLLQRDIFLLQQSIQLGSETIILPESTKPYYIREMCLLEKHCNEVLII